MNLINMFRWQILLKFTCMIKRGKPCKYAINITLIKDRFKIIWTLSKPYILKITNQDISQGWAELRFNSYLLIFFVDSPITKLDKLRTSCLAILRQVSLPSLSLENNYGLPSYCWSLLFHSNNSERILFS